MGFYLLDHPNRIPQYGVKRRGGHEPSGTIVIHTAENVADLIGADLGAENVAAYVARRTSYGSYHRIVDADSIIAMVPFGYEAWHCRVTNNFSIGISMAVRADDWDRYSADYVTRVLRNAARAAAEAVRDLKKYWGVVVPIAHISGSDARRQRPGFTGHGETDPDRRHDPGDGFPWRRFLLMVAEELDRGDGAELVSNPVTPPKPKPSGKRRRPRRMRTIRRGKRGWQVRVWQEILRASGHRLAADGIFGPVTARQTRGWQAARGLTPDAVVGPRTWARSLQADEDGVLEAGDRGPHVQVLQHITRARRDGIFGSGTAEATRRVQRYLSVTPDARVGGATVSALTDHWT